MSSAIEEVIHKTLSIRKSAEKYGVNPSTLESRIKSRKKSDVEIVNLRSFHSKYASFQVFSTQEEAVLNNYIIDCSKMHYGLTCIQVRKLAYEFATSNNLKIPQSWNEKKNGRERLVGKLSQT